MKGHFIVRIQPHFELVDFGLKRRRIKVADWLAVERSSHDLGHLRAFVELDILHPLPSRLFFGETCVFPFVAGILEIRLVEGVELAHETALRSLGMRSHPAQAPRGKFHAIPAAHRRLETIWLEPLRLNPPDDAGEQRYGVCVTFELRPANHVTNVGLGIAGDGCRETGRKFAAFKRHRAVHSDGSEYSALIHRGLAPDLGFWPLGVLHRGQVQRDIHGLHVFANEHRGEVQRAAHLVEPGLLSILGQQFLYAQQRQMEQVAQGALVLDPVHASHRCERLLRFRLYQRGAQFLQERRTRSCLRLVRLFRRHFAFQHPIK